MSDPIELRILRKRMALRQRQYLRGGFWPRFVWYRAANDVHGWRAGLNGRDAYGAVIGVYVVAGSRCLGFNWRFAPRSRRLDVVQAG